jgi:hypothetical protein
MKYTYKFTALCKSGAEKYVEIEANNFREARAQLALFIESN